MTNTNYQRSLLETYGYNVNTPLKHIKVGLLQYGGYFSQIFQGGHNYIHQYGDMYYHIEITRFIPIEQTGYGLIADADVVVLADAADALMSMMLPIINNGNCLTLTRYAKNVQQWVVAAAARAMGLKDNDLTEDSVYRFKPLLTYSTYGSHTPNILNPLTTKRWWVLKPDNDAMSKNICYFNGEIANLMTFLNRFRTTSNDAEYTELLGVIKELQNQDALRLKPNAQMKDYNFKKYYGGHIVAQERITNFKEFRLLKDFEGAIHVLTRRHSEDCELPSNEDIHFTDWLGTWDIESGYQATMSVDNPDIAFFNSDSFDLFMRVFHTHPGFQFISGSIDLFLTDEKEFGIFEFQPQFGIMDVPLVLMDKYVKTFFDYIINQYTNQG